MITNNLISTLLPTFDALQYSHEKAVQLTGTKKWAETYAANQACLLLHMREIVALAINESRKYYRELLNALHMDCCVYKFGDQVLAWRSVKSIKTRGDC